MKRKKEEGVALAAFGDGTTSTLGFHSGLNFAGVLGVPVVFLCQNNQWAISCPSEQQTASESYAVKGEAYGVPSVSVDGNSEAKCVVWGEKKSDGLKWDRSEDTNSGYYTR